MARTKSVEAAKAAIDNAIDEYLRARFAEAITFTTNGIHPAKRRAGGKRRGRPPLTPAQRAEREAAKTAAKTTAKTAPPVVTRARKARAKKAAEA